jgi:chromosome segregation ATPase
MANLTGTDPGGSSTSAAVDPDADRLADLAYAKEVLLRVQRRKEDYKRQVEFLQADLSILRDALYNDPCLANDPQYKASLEHLQNQLEYGKEGLAHFSKEVERYQQYISSLSGQTNSISSGSSSGSTSGSKSAGAIIPVGKTGGGGKQGPRGPVGKAGKDAGTSKKSAKVCK